VTGGEQDEEALVELPVVQGASMSLLMGESWPVRAKLIVDEAETEIDPLESEAIQGDCGKPEGRPSSESMLWPSDDQGSSPSSDTAVCRWFMARQ